VVSDLKKEFIDLLEKDIEFRYAIAGYLGLSEILKRLDRLEENQNKLWENQNRMWEEIRSLREDQKKLWENQNKLWEEVKSLRENQNKLWEEVRSLREEQHKIWEEIRALREGQNRLWEEVRALREGQNKLWEEVRALREGQNKLWEEVRELRKEQHRMDVTLGAIGNRWGRDIELAIMQTYEEALKELGIDINKVEKLEVIDKEGKYGQKGSQYEVDIYAHDTKTYFIEIKSFANKDDVRRFALEAYAITQLTGKKADKLILITININKETLEVAKKYNVEVIYGRIIE